MIAAGFLMSVFCFFVGSVLAGMPFGHLYDLPSLVAIVSGLGIFIFCTGNFETFKQGMKTAFTIAPSEEEKSEKVAHFFKTLGSVSFAVGFLWTVLGLISMLSNLDPEKIGSGIAVSLLTLFYGFSLGLFFFYPISVQHRKFNIHIHHKESVTRLTLGKPRHFANSSSDTFLML